MSELHRRRDGFLLQPLEERVLFAGLTVIAHDIEPFGERPAWLDATGDAIVARTGEDTSVYALHVAATEDPEFYDLTLEWLSGTAALDGDNAEIILLVDWADVSDPTATDTTVSDIGFFVSEYLFEIDSELGIDMPWAELPLHLIGHGRGAGVVSELAWYLGNYGIWVDQLTLLDPPSADLYPDDQPVAVYENVLFSDAWYQTVDGRQGTPVTGAVNHDLSADVTTHAGIHEWYLATISSGGAGVGYDFSRIHGGQRDPLGINENLPLEGSGLREPIERSGTQWPNVGFVTLGGDGDELLQGHPLGFEFLFQDEDSDADVEYYLDEDTNPYNGNVWLLSAELCTSSGEGIDVYSATVPTIDVPSGVYHLLVFVADADGQMRYAYADAPVTLLSAAPQIGSLAPSSARVIDGEELTLTAQDVSPDSLHVAFAHDTDGDGAYDAAIDQLIFVDMDGSDGWSFTGPIDGLLPGVNRLFAIATDADSLTSDAAATTVIRAVPDKYEENDSRAAARDLGLQAGITAYRKLNLLDDSADWFAFQLGTQADRRHVVKINFKQSKGDLSLSLYDGKGRLIRTGTQSLNKERVILDGLGKGKYFVRVTGDAHPHYKLTIDAPDPAVRRSRPTAANSALGHVPFVFSLRDLFNSRRLILDRGDDRVL